MPRIISDLKYTSSIKCGMVYHSTDPNRKYMIVECHDTYNLVNLETGRTLYQEFMTLEKLESLLKNLVAQPIHDCTITVSGVLQKKDKE